MSVAELGYKIDSSGAVVAAANLDDMTAAAVRAEKSEYALSAASKSTATSIATGQRAARATAASFKGLGASAVMAAGEAREYQAQMDAIRAKFNPLFAASKQYEAALDEIAQAERLGAISAKEASAARDLAARSMLDGASAADRYGKSIRAANSGTMQGVALGYQLQDVMITSQMGIQSVGMIALQQGSQMAGQLNMIASTGGKVFPTLVSGFTSLINPISLVAIGGTAIVAAIAKFGFEAFGAASGADALKERLDDLADVMEIVDGATDLINSSTDELVEKYGFAAARVRDFALAQAELAQSQAERRLRDQVGLLDEVTKRYAEVGEAVEIAGYKMGNDLPLANLQRDLKVNADQAMILMDAFTQLDTAVTFNEQQAALSGILKTMEEQGVALSLLPGELQDAVSEMITLSNEADAAAAAMQRLAGAAAGVTTGVPLFLQGMTGDELLPPDPSPLGRGGGGGTKVDQYAADLEALRTSLLNEREVLEQWKLEQDTLLADQRAIELLGIEEHNQAKLRLEEEYNQRRVEIAAMGEESKLSLALGGAADVLGVIGQFNDKAFKLAKVAAAAQALISTLQGSAEALKLPYPYNLIAAAQVAAKGFGLVAAIKGVSSSGGSASISAGGTSSAAGVTATSSAAEVAPQTQTVIQLEGTMAEVVGPMLDAIIKGIQSESDDGVIITGIQTA